MKNNPSEGTRGDAGRLRGKRIVLGVCGSIAAYKAVGLLRALVEEGAEVSVVMTESARRFVAPLTFEVLSRHPVATDLFDAPTPLPHLTLAEQADLLVIAPATANLLAKAALGLADDLLSAMLLATPRPLVIAPAMDGDMWSHPAVQAHVRALRERGAVVIEPEEGPLASGRIGRGRLVEESVILGAISGKLAARQDWAGERVLVSAGPTQEAIDPVRFISNRSSGKMGYAVARAAVERGAEVVLVSGPTALAPPAGVELVPVVTAEEMAKALTLRFDWATVLVMAAAVADFRPRRPAARKVKKAADPWRSLDLEPTTDILATLSQKRTSQVLVGFAAETDELLPHARMKLERKGLDLIVANDVTIEGAGFGSDSNAAVLLDRLGRETAVPLMPKRALADRILDVALELRRTPRPGS